jgi:hypothetical protein
VRVPRQDLNLKDVHEPSSNRKPMYWMLSMLCARPRLAPHAPAPPCAAPQGPDEYRTRALRSASLVPVAEEQPAEEGTTRKEVRGGRAWAA